LDDILWLDDGQIADLHIEKGYNKTEPRVEITVVELRD
jgi:Holliday junction resolvase RusA-like endonuclease